VTGPRFEIVLARLYTDDAFRARFLSDPEQVALTEGLTPVEAQALAAINREGLELAATSFSKKRESKRKPK
jgi:hypothetical protein